MNSSTLNVYTLAQTMMSISVWKPLLILLLIVPWAVVVSTVYDKHSNMFALPRRRWNLIHMLAAVVGLGLCLFLPVLIGSNHGAFFVGWGAMLIVLTADLIAYPMVANKDDRVTVKHKITFTYILKSQQAEKKAKGGEEKSAAKVALVLRGADERGKFTLDVPVPQPETPELEVRMAGEQLYINALGARASQVDIQPISKDAYGVSYLVDGVRTNAGDPLPVVNAVKLMDFWRGAAKLDVNDRRRKQDNMVQVDAVVGGARNIVRVISQGVQGGMRVTLLFNPDKAVTKNLEDLGLLAPQMEELKKIIDEAKGVVLLCSKADQGRTTTFYAITRKHDAYTQNVQTVEMDPTAAIEGVRTNKFDPTVDPAAGGALGGGEFSTLVRSILRRDPTVVSVSDLPDPATAKEIAKADHQRTRIYVSFQAADALTAVQIWGKAVGEPRQAGNALHGVVAQKLIRKLCTNCRVAYPPTGEMLKKLGLPEGKITQLFKKGGQVLIKNKPEVCPVCRGVGYVGQEGVFEIYSIGPEERELISTGNLQGLRAAFKKRQLPSIQNVALRKAVDGITSVEEVIRVTTETPPASGTQQSASGAAAPAAKA